MNLEDFFDYKNQFMNDILTKEEIVRLLDDTISLEHAEELVYKQVFPFEYIPDTIEHGHTFICCDVDIQSPSYRSQTSKTLFYSPVISIWVMSHKSKLVLPKGGVRTDRLCSEICKAINGSMYYGIGKLNLYSVKRFAPVVDFQGKVMTFTTTEWNQPYNPPQDVPSQRKC